MRQGWISERMEKFLVFKMDYIFIDRVGYINIFLVIVNLDIFLVLEFVRCVCLSFCVDGPALFYHYEKHQPEHSLML